MISDDQIKDVLPEAIVNRYPRWGALQTALWDSLGQDYWDLTTEEQDDVIARALILAQSANVLLVWDIEVESS